MGILDILFGIEKKKDFFEDDTNYDDMIDTELFDSENFDNDVNDLFDSDASK